MATKKCPNGHQYDSAIYGENCPFCPNAGGGHTKVNDDFDPGEETKAAGWFDNRTRPTETMNHFDGNGGRTVIRNAGGNSSPDPDGGRKLVGILASFSDNPAGEVYKIYEGVTSIGRARTCDISFPNDSHMSGKHLSIQFIAAKGVFKATDQGSSNGTFVNGQVYVLGDIIELKSNDVIIIGSSKFVFLAIPEF